LRIGRRPVKLLLSLDGFAFTSPESPAMKRLWFGVVALAVSLPALCAAQPAPAAKDKPSPAASARAAARDLAADLREARELLKKVNDRKTRDRLELLLSRAELRAADIQKGLAALAAPPRRVALSADEFAKFLKGVHANAFDTGKLPFVEDYAKTRWFSSAQVRDVLKDFAFDDGRVKAAVVLHPRLTDPENFFTVLDVFAFDSSRKALREKLKLK
jgi:hypothetical protein